VLPVKNFNEGETTMSRPLKYKTAEERAAAKKRYNATSRTKIRSIYISAEAKAEIETLSGTLEKQFGFRPTFSQALTWLLKQRRQS
jgi:hypothetical protein